MVIPWSRIKDLQQVLQRIEGMIAGGRRDEAMAELEAQVPEWAEANRDQIDDHLWVLELQLAANPFVCGDVLTVADITAGIAIDFMKPSRVPLPEDFVHIRRWHGEVSARPSWKA